MFLRAILAVLALVSLAGPTAAAGAKKEEKKGDAGQYVDLQPVGLPIVHNRRLVNYVFVYVRINLTSSANVAKLREKEPFFRDALVRSAHRTPFTHPTDLSQLDVPKLSAALVRDATAIVGSGQIRSVEVTSQAPRRRIATPRA
ncbi:hypothetical protein [Phenylobacterium kunshanense]|uniref:Uncharacterized protein n=1 Tax=Phenylobacterium kunshanense TaxID=1445034 RepID=A0A328BPS3_9CAUL|nr:hypothetical protein [Phenylobacterium kunshanense]RAK68695.1 hypothetical protein DJ019_01360 [Phenylobacterium kunshanense]